jgi:hypothetical protein
MAVDRGALAAKLRWIEENSNPSDSEATEALAQAMELTATEELIGGERAVLLDDFSEESAELLDQLCDLVAAEKGFAWGELKVPPSGGA